MTFTPFLDVKNLVLSYRTPEGDLTAVNNISFTIDKPGQALAIVGESGCGKSSLISALLQGKLLPNNVSEFSGEIWFEGRDIKKMSESELRDEIRWKKIAVVPQSPDAVFNPVKKIKKPIEEVLKKHKADVEDYDQEVKRLLSMVGLRPEYADLYPYQLSGGMRQRASIALAFALKPSLILLDEPTSALDVSMQGGIINLFRDLSDEFQISYIFVTHDIVLATKFCDFFAVIYGGKIVEQGAMRDVISSPLHPYTKKLLECVPRFDEEQVIAAIPGEPPDLRQVKNICPFVERESVRCAECPGKNMPKLIEYENEHFAACHGIGSS